MSSSEEQTGDDSEIGIGDDQLPEDLVPGEDNPLAESLEDGESVDDLLEDGKPAAESGGSKGSEGSDESRDRDDDSSS